MTDTGNFIKFLTQDSSLRPTRGWGEWEQNSKKVIYTLESMSNKIAFGVAQNSSLLGLLGGDETNPSPSSSPTIRD